MSGYPINFASSGSAPFLNADAIALNNNNMDTNEIFGTPELGLGVQTAPGLPGTPRPRPAGGPAPVDMQRFASIGVGLSTLLLERLMSHPCIVLRRQCQVNRSSAKYHLTPFTLVPVAIKLVSQQGLGTLWKGASSVFIVHGLAMGVDTALSDILNFPKEVYIYSPPKQLAKHLLLKLISLASVTPFLCSSLVETVQSDIASEKPGIADCLKEGLFRVIQWGKPRTSRMLPIWTVLGPTVVHGLLAYSISAIAHSVAVWYLKIRMKNNQQRPANQTDRLVIEVMASFVGSIVADVVLYPMETILHRLYLQGTRAIIDDLDSGLAVTPIVTRYDGPMDCFRNVVQEEGAAGLYRGFGAVVMQYCLQALIIKGTCCVLNNVRLWFSDKNK